LIIFTLAKIKKLFHPSTNKQKKSLPSPYHHPTNSYHGRSWLGVGREMVGSLYGYDTRGYARKKAPFGGKVPDWGYVF
jgi:hypothetical protein